MSVKLNLNMTLQPSHIDEFVVKQKEKNNGFINLEDYITAIYGDESSCETSSPRLPEKVDHVSTSAGDRVTRLFYTDMLKPTALFNPEFKFKLENRDSTSKGIK